MACQYFTTLITSFRTSVQEECGLAEAIDFSRYVCSTISNEEILSRGGGAYLREAEGMSLALLHSRSS